MVTENKISPKEAAEAASKFYKDTTNNYASMKLEEIELIENYWYVTLSIEEGGFITDKNYKIFKVDATNGYVEYMKIKK